MLRPIRFFYGVNGDGLLQVVLDIGNPLIWWSGTLAVLAGRRPKVVTTPGRSVVPTKRVEARATEATTTRLGGSSEAQRVLRSRRSWRRRAQPRLRVRARRRWARAVRRGRRTCAARRCDTSEGLRGRRPRRRRCRSAAARRVAGSVADRPARRSILRDLRVKDARGLSSATRVGAVQSGRRAGDGVSARDHGRG